MSELLRHEIEKLKKIIKKPSVKALKEIKQLLKLVAKAQAKVSCVPTTWKKEYVTLLNSEWVPNLQDGDESYLFFACFIIVHWLKPTDETLDEMFELTKKKTNPAVIQKWLNEYDKAGLQVLS